MNLETIKSYLDEYFKDFNFRKTIKNAIYFFLECSLLAKTLVPTKEGAGRSIPLFFTGYIKEELPKYESQSSIEKKAILKVLTALSHVTDITIVADRGFDAPDLLELLKEQKVNFIIRSKTKRYITLGNGKRLKLTHDIIKKGEQKKFRDVSYTLRSPVVLHVYSKWDKGQDEPWILLSNKNTSIEKITSLYARRWEIEEMFKSFKNQDVGFDIKVVKLRHLDRWLRLLFMATVLFQFLSSLGKSVRKIHKIEQRYSLSSKAPANQKWIYSIYSIAIHVLEDIGLELKYYRGTFQFKYANTSWVNLS